MARPKIIKGQLLPAGDLRVINTPLVKIAFSASQEVWPAKHYTDDARYRSTVDFLRGIADQTISDFEISAISVLVFERFTYAKNWRLSRGLSKNDKRSKPKKELQALKAIARKGCWSETFDAFTKLSQFTRDLLSDVTGEIYLTSAIASLPNLLTAIDIALRDPTLNGRPREFELDRCASASIAIYERLTGSVASLANDPTSGRPVSRLHRFVRTLAEPYDIQIVTDASDDRIGKMMNNRTEFGRGEMLLAAYDRVGGQK